MRPFSRQLRHTGLKVVVDGEVHQRARAKAQQRLAGPVAVVAVLTDRRAPLLLEERLQLIVAQASAVDEQDQVDRARIAALRRTRSAPA